MVKKLLVVLLVVSAAATLTARQLTFGYQFSVFAGRPPAAGAVDGAGSSASFRFPFGVAVAADGVTYVADSTNHTIRRINTDGVVSTLAGVAGHGGYVDGPNVLARFDTPMGLTVDADGDVIVVDSANHVIRRITPQGQVTTLAGVARVPGMADGVGAEARFSAPHAIAGIAGGDYVISDTRNGTIRRMTSSGSVTTLVGTAAGLNYPAGIAAHPDGSIVVADAENHAIRRVTLAGVVTTIAGSTTRVSGAVDANGTAARFSVPAGVAVDAAGVIYVSDSSNYTLRRIGINGEVTTLAGTALQPGRADGTGSAARFGGGGLFPFFPGITPWMLASHPDGGVVVADASNHAIRRVTAAGVVSTVAGGGVDDQAGEGYRDGILTAARFTSPSGVAMDALGNLFVSETSGTIRKISAAGAVTTFAGAPQTFAFADGPGTAARFWYPSGLAAAANGDLYVADTGNDRIRRITPDGMVSTIADAERGPIELAVDGTGQIYFTQEGSHAIHRVETGGTVTVFAGNETTPGSTDGARTAARFRNPTGIAIAPDGTMLVADSGNHTIRRIAADGAVSTLAGLAGVAGTVDGVGAPVRFNNPRGVTLGAGSVLYVTEFDSCLIREVRPSGAVRVIGGSGRGFEDGFGARAMFFSPKGITFRASDGALLIADSTNDVIRLGTLLSGEPPLFTAHPTSVSIAAGGSATFSATVVGSPAPAIEWQRSVDGGASWSPVPESAPFSGTTTSTLRITNADTSIDGQGFRAFASTTTGAVASAAARLRVLPMTATPSTLQFGVRTSSAGVWEAQSASQEVIVTVGTGVSGTWTATATQPWVTIAPPSGSTSGRFVVTITRPSGSVMTQGTLTALISVTHSNAAPVTVPITVALSSTASRVSGAFDAPANGATGITGSLALGGWALDTIGVERIEIWRNCVTAIDGPRGACVVRDRTMGVFIGNASVVPGARPDVEQQLPSRPDAQRAGWGYLLLTNALPHQPNGTAEGGQGTFVLHADVITRDGTRVALGQKTITLTNDSATQPFGTLDTPEQGATIPGSAAPFNDPANYPVFGWAMTQVGKCIDTTSTSSYRVYVDGVARTLTPGVNWFPGLNRSDLAAAYPGRCNSTNALAAYYLDVRTLANGLHTIGWDVTDDGNNSAGIGSRFVNVLVAGDHAVSDARVPQVDVPALAPVASRSVHVRIGSDDAPWQAVARDAGGVWAARVPMGGRIVLDLGGAVTHGVQLMHGDARPLPAGSTLQADAGRFSWMPPVGFLGTFTLAMGDGDGRIDLQVTVFDPTTTTDEVEVVLSSPRAGANPNPVVTVAGTAVDPLAATGSGVPTVHVWARRVDVAADPEFLGAAVMAGDHFSLNTRPLAPGTYEVMVFAWQARRNMWAPATVVVLAVR